MNPDEVMERLRRPREIGRQILSGNGRARVLRRGDHDLNPGTRQNNGFMSAAVLVPLVKREAELTVLLTRRTDHLDRHAGQVAFPGGRCEAEETPHDAALRETEEEIGLGGEFIEMIGRLDTYETRTGFEVTPLVGLVETGFELAPDPDEVADVFEVPLSFIMDPINHERHSGEFEGMVRDFYVLPHDTHYIWGATAGMLINLYEVLSAES
ncbi:MAG: NUDIX hydrolase [Alphaproteobacteria bacterium]